MVIPVLGLSPAVIGLQLDNAMWVLIKQMSDHLGAIAHEVKQIVDDVKEVRDSRRMKVRLQAGGCRQRRNKRRRRELRQRRRKRRDRRAEIRTEKERRQHRSKYK